MALLLHITDTHLYGDPHRQLKGIDTNKSCSAVLDHAAASMHRPDAIILGGDMSQDHSESSYQNLAALLRDWHSPFMLSPGNHADLRMLENVLIPRLERISSFHRELLLDRWQIISLNTHVPGEVAGSLAGEELSRLDALLGDARGRHALIAMHHPPVEIGSRWMDEIGLSNAGAFWDVVERHAHVRAVLCGHIHQEFDAHRGPVRILGTPSTCIQFRPNCDDFQLDDRSPGYRWLELLPDGQIDTGVERIDGFMPPDLKDNSFY